MSVIIYTYRDPYKLKENKELWKEISSCPYFCAAQTLVNGLKVVYGAAFQIGRVTTVKNLTDVLYEKWNGTACAVKQHADIDNIIVNSSDITGISRIELDNVKKSFLFNRDEVFTSIRTMFELKMEPQNIVDKYLTPEQRFIVSVYKKIRASEKVKDFCLEQDFTEEQINKAIIKAMTTAKDNSSTKNEIEVETLDHIVIHGVHQFSPLLLRAIEEIAKYKKVILLINYQEQYKNIYQTWIDIYSAFDCEIQNFDGIEYYPVDVSAVSYDGNLLAHNIGKLIGGHKEDISVRKPYEIIEFDNTTEFASYVAKVFEDAEKKDPEHPMNAMKEQIYAADSSVNDILKVYFPEQFGERQFLNYPLGHFFIAIANMWDSETNGIIISDITITDCYLKLANKKNLIQTIVMDPESLDLRYLSENGAEVPKDSLSAGEQQLMVISILWALALCSKKKLPVIIDTPLSRLDSLHRTALITTYFPNAGEQTIILSTDSEIDAGYYQLMKENIGDEFTLNYDENSKSTSIERGYLIGAKL